MLQDRGNKIKLKAYIIGPITGVKNWKGKFKTIKKFLEKKDYIVLSPLDYPEGLTQKEHMMLSIQNVFIADTIVRLNNWEHSLGAIAENALAKKIGLKIIDFYKDKRIKK